jgi:nucleoside-diphosphate-sugar epimerase
VLTFDIISKCTHIFQRESFFIEYSLQSIRSAKFEALEKSLATYAERREWMQQAAHELDQARLTEGEEDALRTNVLGTLNVLQACLDDGLLCVEEIAEPACSSSSSV